MARGYMYRVPDRSVDSFFKRMLPPIIIPVFQLYREQTGRSPGSSGELCYSTIGMGHFILAGSFPHVVLANEFVNGAEFSKEQIDEEYERTMKAGADWFVELNPRTPVRQQMRSFYQAVKPR